MQMNYQQVSMRFRQSGISYRSDRLLPKEVGMVTFADRLKNVRKERGLSQVELADKAGIKQNQYSRYENGTVPEPDLLVRFAIALECTTDYLLGHTDDPNTFREYDELPEDEKNLIQLYRAYKRGDHIPRAGIRMLRDLNVTDEPKRAAIEPPQEPDVSGEQKAANS